MKRMKLMKLMYFNCGNQTMYVSTADYCPNFYRGWIHVPSRDIFVEVKEKKEKALLAYTHHLYPNNIIWTTCGTSVDIMNYDRASHLDTTAEVYDD